jgi:hypothetical protein
MNAQDKPLVMILLKRAAILAIVVCAVSAFYWAVGAKASFLDETQLMLLGIVRFASLFIIAVSGLGIVVAIVLALARRYRYHLAGTLGYLLASAFGATALALAQSVLRLSSGLR